MKHIPIFLTGTLAAGVLATSAGTARYSGPAVAPAPPPGLETAIIPNPLGQTDNPGLLLARIRAAGATRIRLDARWNTIAPVKKPAGFNPTDPADPAYDWSALDSSVVRARGQGLDPILLVLGAPAWAQAKRPASLGPHDGPYKPDPVAFGNFARALATRYSGSFQRLPRVRSFIAWNEPNIYRYLTPQRVNGKPFSPEWYRRMVNYFADAVHAVHSDNRVVAGALLFNGVGDRISPLAFMREMLCMSKPKKRGKKILPPRPTCSRQSTFDVWSHHPYSRGDPFHHAPNKDDVMIGDLPTMRQMLTAAVAAHHVVTRQKIQFWVDEFSYDSRPPDPSNLAVPVLLHARWVSESLYQMWRSGVSLATWFLLRDEPVVQPTPGGYGQSGLYSNQTLTRDLKDDRPKPALAAFRFPFVAYRKGKRVTVWGRTPKSSRGKVVIQVGTATGWRRVAAVRAGSKGIFKGKFSTAVVKSKMRGRGAKARYPQTVLADKPRSYWRLDDRGNVARDQLRHAPGTYKGAPTRGAPGAFRRDRAVLFGPGSRVALPAMKVPRAIELWVRTTAPGTVPEVSFRDDSPSSLYVRQLRGYARASEGDASVASYSRVSDGRWHHLVFSISPGNTARFYVDGTLHDEAPWRPSSGSSAASLAYDPLLDTSFLGVMDEVAVYNHALSAKQVARHYNASGRTVGTLGMLRARIAGSTSWPFSLKRPRDRFVLAFG
jgi:hypothetical protein